MNFYVMANAENYKSRFPISSGAPFALASLFTSVQHFLQMLVYYTGAQITILKGTASIPPSTAVTQRSLPTCSLANYVLSPCTVNSCLCTSCAVGAPPVLLCAQNT